MTSQASLAVALALFTAGLAGSPSVAQEAPPPPARLTDFGLEVFRGVVAEADGPNVVFSPLSVGLALALVAEGAEGETRAEILAALGVEEAGWPSYATSLGRLAEEYGADTVTVARLASSLWADAGRTVAPPVRARLEGVHGARVDVLDLQSPAAAEAVNRWAAEKTEGRITEIMPAPDPSASLLVLNAVYFRAKWERPFSARATRPLPFFPSEGDSVMVPTLWRTGYYGRFGSDGARGVRLPYRGGRFAAYVVLPESGKSVDELARGLTVEGVASWADSVREERVELHLPRFELEGSLELTDPLRDTGVRRALSEGTAELERFWADPRPSERTWVSQASQGTFLRVDEEGTEAAAVTLAEVVSTSVPPPPTEFFVDRPFLFLVRDETSGALLFVARVGLPEGG